MQCLILAGGLATRLRPQSLQVPKAMIVVAGEPFIAHHLRLMRREARLASFSASATSAANRGLRQGRQAIWRCRRLLLRGPKFARNRRRTAQSPKQVQQSYIGLLIVFEVSHVRQEQM